MNARILSLYGCVLSACGGGAYDQVETWPQSPPAKPQARAGCEALLSDAQHACPSSRIEAFGRKHARCPDCTDACPTCEADLPSIVEPAPQPLKLEVVKQCTVFPGGVILYAIIPTAFEFKKGLGLVDKTERVAWQLNCELPSGKCFGTKLDLGRADKGEPMGLFDIDAVSNARVASVTGKVATIQWGPWRTFVVDSAKGEVTYTESGPTTEGRGKAKCR